MTENLIDRREFMKSTVAGLGGFSLLASNDKKQEKTVIGKDSKKRKFIYRTLGKTGIKFPVISMGTLGAGDPILIRSALDAGIVHLDTAFDYGTEQNIGKMIKGRPRESYVIATKIYLSPAWENLVSGGIKEEIFFEKLDESLERLGLDYVDIYYRHMVTTSEDVLSEPILKAMEKAKKTGKIRFAGVSTHANEPQVIQAAIDSKFYDVVLTSYNYKQSHYQKLREAIAKAAQAGLGVVAMKVMAGSDFKNFSASAALKWVLQDPNVHTAILGFTNFDQMNLDLSVMEDLTLTDSEKKALQKEASLPGLYCQGCGQCVKQCLAKLPIPDLMRAYMYAYGYRQPSIAQNLVVSLDLPSQVCKDCPSCPVKCLNRWNVSRKIQDVVRLKNVTSKFLA